MEDGTSCMHETEPICAKCATKMEAGFLLDHGDGGRMYKASRVPGPVEKSFFLGLKLRRKWKSMLEVQTFRCRVCGYLESFALKSL